jgi:glycosyltransferase involved in cell wall biosynthesis
LDSRKQKIRMKDPLISICIPTYNGEKYLKDCLLSIVSQTYHNTEIIIVDDCSSDGTTAIVEQFMKEDKRIILSRNEKNLGLVGNWNRSLALAKGEWVKFVFQDDLIAKDCIQKMYDASEGKSLVVSDRAFIYDEFVPAEIREHYSTNMLTLKKLLNTNVPVFISSEKVSQFAADHISLNFIGEPTAVLFKKNIIEKIGVFNTDLSQICDLEYWLRIATAEGMVYIPEELISFRIHSSSTTSQNVISGTKFKPRYIDVIILAHEMLYNTNYKQFRSNISISHLLKLKLFIISKMYEAKKAFETNDSIEPDFFNKLFVSYPALEEFYYPSIMAKMIFNLTLLKRKLKKI